MSIDIRRVSCGMIQENCYIVQAEGRDDCVVVDPGDEYPKLKAAIGDRRVGAVLLTHGHFDHIMAAGDIARDFGAPVYIDAKDVEMLDDSVINGYDFLMGTQQSDWRQLDIFYHRDQSLAGDSKAKWTPIEALPLGESLSTCGMCFKVIPTPGHSQGSVCLYLENEGVLFSGDTLFKEGYGRLDLYGGNLTALIKSLRKLFALPGDVGVYPGHGDLTTIGEEKARYRL